MSTAGIAFPRILAAINLLDTRAITNIAKGNGLYRHKSFFFMIKISARQAADYLCAGILTISCKYHDNQPPINQYRHFERMYKFR